MSDEWLNLDETYIMPTYNRLPLAIERAEQNYLYDTHGKAYLDLFTGLAVNVLGHGHPRVKQALEAQGNTYLHISNYFVAPPAVQLAKRLIEATMPGKVFFANSGAEATEAAVKLVHKWRNAQDEEKNGIVVLSNSFHGRTLGTIRLTRQPGIYQDFPAVDMPVYETPAEDTASLARILEDEQPAAVLMEPVLGSGGIVPLSQTFMEQASALCKSHNVLFIMDEIQTGMGRTGELFAYQHTNVTPDIVLFAKGVGGGLPLGGLIAGNQVKDKFQPGDHGTTFGPSPLSAALGNAVLDALFEDGVLSSSRERAEKLQNGLQSLTKAYPSVVDGVRGLGMMLGMKLKLAPEKVKELRARILDRGILIDVTQQTILRFLPPLTLENAEIEHLLTVLEEELAALAGGLSDE
ncbi:acetylornithine aminotransferase [Salsuginibacillus halophilus]|uniref:Acetylornithine aminotransferase n=1 Tax=Salsuginibacillus halophilus TaxID=517424 RepID=A0A2P8HXF1_9BACI|nr:acetylornithine transaminase [Salsuginibacillus halophilus]PSL50864.1 acetylornithine aminotransferase [Salsuginibacillus halophilus]